jgi:multisubunit Na+/H+ antiporter MnhE subunit
VRFGVLLVSAWAGFLGLWFVFVYQLSLMELLAGAAVAAITVVASEISLRAIPLDFKPEARWLVGVFTLPVIVVKDMVVLVRVLGRLVAGQKIHSLFQVTHFDASVEGSRASAKRVLAVAFTTVSPNSIVLGIDRKSGLLLFHELEKTPLPRIIQELQT